MNITEIIFTISCWLFTTDFFIFYFCVTYYCFNSLFEHLYHGCCRSYISITFVLWSLSSSFDTLWVSLYTFKFLLFYVVILFAPCHFRGLIRWCGSYFGFYSILVFFGSSIMSLLIRFSPLIVLLLELYKLLYVLKYKFRNQFLN